MAHAGPADDRPAAHGHPGLSARRGASVPPPAGAAGFLLPRGRRAEALARYSPQQLWAWATALDPDLSADDVAFVPLRLSELEDEAFAFYGLDADAVAQLRERFSAWSRPPRGD